VQEKVKSKKAVLEKLAENYLKAVTELTEECNATYIYCGFLHEGYSVQVPCEDFFKLFSNEEIHCVKRDSSDYPYEARTKVGDMIFFTLLTQEEYKREVDECD